jgi:hypothetical protein
MATLTGSKLNFFSMVQSNLELEVKKQITDELIKKQLADYEVELRGVISKILESVTFGAIEQFRDYASLRDEYRLFIKINENETKEINNN